MRGDQERETQLAIERREQRLDPPHVDRIEPENGSSQSTISGSVTIARASAARRSMPPESSRGNIAPVPGRPPRRAAAPPPTPRRSRRARCARAAATPRCRIRSSNRAARRAEEHAEALPHCEQLALGKLVDLDTRDRHDAALQVGRVRRSSAEGCFSPRRFRPGSRRSCRAKTAREAAKDRAAAKRQVHVLEPDSCLPVRHRVHPGPPARYCSRRSEPQASGRQREGAPWGPHAHLPPQRAARRRTPTQSATSPRCASPPPVRASTTRSITRGDRTRPTSTRMRRRASAWCSWA